MVIYQENIIFPLKCNVAIRLCRILKVVEIASEDKGECDTLAGEWESQGIVFNLFGVFPTMSCRSRDYFELAPTVSMGYDVNSQTGIDMANARRHASVDVPSIREFLHSMCIGSINCCTVRAHSTAARFQVVAQNGRSDRKL